MREIKKVIEQGRHRARSVEKKRNACWRMKEMCECVCACARQRDDNFHQKHFIPLLSQNTSVVRPLSPCRFAFIKRSHLFYETRKVTSGFNSQKRRVRRELDESICLCHSNSQSTVEMRLSLGANLPRSTSE